MNDLLDVAIMVAFFALAIGLVRLIGRMIERDADPDGLADEPPEEDDAAGGQRGTVNGAGGTVNGAGGLR
jgi:hypothetical protein